jgi:hypothetical protein
MFIIGKMIITQQLLWKWIRIVLKEMIGDFTELNNIFKDCKIIKSTFHMVKGTEIC